MITGIFIGIQLISLVILLLFVQQYSHFTQKHETLLRSIDDKKLPASSFQSYVIIWIYVIVTCSIIIGTTVLYILEPLS